MTGDDASLAAVFPALPAHQPVPSAFFSLELAAHLTAIADQAGGMEVQGPQHSFWRTSYCKFQESPAAGGKPDGWID
jgi:hypothetical protein